MENGEDTKGETGSLPEWPNLCGNLRQRFDDCRSEIWPPTVTGSVFVHFMRKVKGESKKLLFSGAFVAAQTFSVDELLVTRFALQW